MHLVWWQRLLLEQGGWGGGLVRDVLYDIYDVHYWFMFSDKSMPLDFLIEVDKFKWTDKI